MIIKKVRGKNFLSIGNAFLEFDLQTYSKAVISGKNGCGKSTISNLITFGLFDKVIKNISKPQIVNSINCKGTIVEIEITANSNDYLIRRGIKPNLFEIEENGTLIDQTNMGDFQDYLEKNILKTNYKTFIQTTILSIENYKPFMTLSKSERRNFVEDILDIKVFSYMNQIVKGNIARNKEELKIIEVHSKNSLNTAKLQKAHIERLEELHTAGMDNINAKIKSLTYELDILTNNTEAAQQGNETLIQEQSSLNKKTVEHQKIIKEIDKVSTDINWYNEDLIKFHSNTNCPTCNQTLPLDNICLITDPINKQIEILSIRKSKLLIALDLYEDIGSKVTLVNASILKNNNIISTNNSTHSRLRKDISSLQQEIFEMTGFDEIQNLKAELRFTAKEAIGLKTKQTELNIEQDYNSAMLELFKDSGVKSKIIEQYIPIINQLVNGYLEKLDFFVSFNLDSEFNEIIKSRHRDDFSYSSFSAGEQQRIDIALLFTFRQLAKMRNSVDCNLMFLDEILDSSLDMAGIDNLLNIFSSDDLKNSNIIVVSHRNKELFEDRFDGSYEVYKESGFSQIRDVTKI
jgi:DNA repair exonuclease SbcCD ATPase subunit